MSRRPPTNNPYGKAAQNYASQGKRQEDSRETEAKALLKAAKMLQDLQTSWDGAAQTKIEDALKFNRRIWILFYDNAVSGSDQAQSKTLSTNVINLANFVFKRSTEILASPEADKLNILISINREVATGLMSRRENSKQ